MENNGSTSLTTGSEDGELELKLKKVFLTEDSVSEELLEEAAMMIFASGYPSSVSQEKEKELIAALAKKITLSFRWKFYLNISISLIILCASIITWISLRRILMLKFRI